MRDTLQIALINRQGAALGSCPGQSVAPFVFPVPLMPPDPLYVYLVVVEELDGIIETHVRSLGLPVEGKSLFTPIGEYNQDTVRKVFGSALNEKADCEVNVPVRPPMMCAGCPHRGMFYALSKNKITVMGDIGCYTLGAQAPLTALDSTLCMGASVSGLHGFNLADKGQRRTACVIGDSTFIHSGITGLINVAYNSTSSTVIVLDNSITGMTGHQQNPTTGRARTMMIQK